MFWLNSDWVADRLPVGLDWSSAVTTSIVRPLTPPAAFTASKYALAPSAASKNVDEALPVTEVTNPILTDVGVTPGALAVLPDAPPVVGEGLPDAVVGVDELFELDEHPAASNAAKVAVTTNAWHVRFTTGPPIRRTLGNGERKRSSRKCWLISAFLSTWA